MIRDSKARIRVLATRCNVRVEILLSHLSKFVPSSESGVQHEPSGASSLVQFRNTLLLMQSEGWQRVIWHDARPVYLLPVRKSKSKLTWRSVTYGKAPSSHWPGDNKPNVRSSKGSSHHQLRHKCLHGVKEFSCCRM